VDELLGIGNTVGQPWNFGVVREEAMGTAVEICGTDEYS